MDITGVPRDNYSLTSYAISHVEMPTMLVSVIFNQIYIQNRICVSWLFERYTVITSTSCDMLSKKLKLS